MKHVTNKLSNGYRETLVLSLVTAAAVFLPGIDAAAASTNLCGFLNAQVFTTGGGDIVKGVATLGVISVAVGATFGRVSWGAAVLVAVGIAALFGARGLAQALGAGC